MVLFLEILTVKLIINCFEKLTFMWTLISRQKKFASSLSKRRFDIERCKNFCHTFCQLSVQRQNTISQKKIFSQVGYNLLIAWCSQSNSVSLSLSMILPKTIITGRIGKNFLCQCLHLPCPEKETFFKEGLLMEVGDNM